MNAKTCLLALTLVTLSSVTSAQELSAPTSALDAAEKEAVVLTISELLDARYVYPELGKQSGDGLVARFRAGEFDEVSQAGAFAVRVTEALQAVSNDKHLRVRLREPEMANAQREDPERAAALRAERSRRNNYGFARVERLEGNVGYVDMRGFSGSPEATPIADAAMAFIANTDAVIFDMRNNGGGSPGMVRYVSSWFFAEPTHLNSLYFREGDRTIEFWTLEEVPGVPRPDVPIFVLTSSRTFSGAEEFSYNMLTQERATLIGEVTGGGANPGGMVPINDRFEMFIPTGAAVNPITGTNWEGVGVTPHIEVPADEAFDLALEKAQVAAEQYRAKREAQH
jgi:C-terminal processing protease CtpA/Prc